METKSKKMMMITALVSLIIIGLVMLNGCEKSEPTTSSKTTEMTTHEMALPDTTTDVTLHAAANGQTLCPIMDAPINTDIFVEYQGKKVYFCCSGCETKFLENPEEYVTKLPQFTE